MEDEHICKICQTPIPPTGKKGRPRVLCPDCKTKAAEAKREKQRAFNRKNYIESIKPGRKAAREKKGPIERVCKTCGKVFLPRNNVQTYCSSSCREEAHLSSFEPPETKICIVCGTPFETYVKHQAMCGPRCRGEKNRLTRLRCERKIKEQARRWREEHPEESS